MNLKMKKLLVYNKFIYGFVVYKKKFEKEKNEVKWCCYKLGNIDLIKRIISRVM